MYGTTRSQVASGKSIYSFNSIKSSTFDLGNLDRIDEETFERLKGQFYDLIVCQNGSRTLQKIIKSTHYCILSRILDEVIVF